MSNMFILKILPMESQKSSKFSNVWKDWIIETDFAYTAQYKILNSKS